MSESTTFSTQDKLDALKTALTVGAISQAQHDAHVAKLTNKPNLFICIASIVVILAMAGLSFLNLSHSNIVPVSVQKNVITVQKVITPVVAPVIVKVVQ